MLCTVSRREGDDNYVIRNFSGAEGLYAPPGAAEAGRRRRRHQIPVLECKTHKLNLCKVECMRELRSGFTTLMLAFLMMMALSARASAAEQTVVNLNNNGAGSLRQAILDAAAGDIVVFSTGGTITLSSRIDITKDLTIQGPGVCELTVSGNNAVPVFRIDGADVTINSLRIANGRETSAIDFGGIDFVGGGGVRVFANATLEMNECEVVDCSALHAAGEQSIGAGIYTLGDVTIRRCTFVGNNHATSSNGFGGGGIALEGVLTATIEDCTFSGNSAATGSSSTGGGMLVDAFNGNLTANIINCTFYNNSTDGAFGGGIQQAEFNGNCQVNNQNNIFQANGGRSHHLLVGTVNTSGGGNIYDDVPTASTVGSDQTSTSPGVNTILAFNGGPTRTHALNSSSNAVNAGIATGASLRDQRNFTRFGAHDSGAFELDGSFSYDALSPADDADNVAVDANLLLTFDHLTTTATGNIEIRQTVGNILFESIPLSDARVTGDNTKSITINPSGTLAASTAYHVIVPTSAFSSVLGESFEGIAVNSEWNFMTAAPANTPPVIATSATAFSIDEDVVTTLAVTLSDAESATSALLMSATSSNQALLPDANLTQVGATQATTLFRTTLATNQVGSVVVTFTADDGAASASTMITLTVNPINDAPLVAVSSALVTTAEDASTALSLQVSDVDTPFNLLILSATSSNQSLVADGGLSFGATGATTTLFIVPVTNATGQAAITVTVDDGVTTGSTSFTLTVNPVNDAPLISTNNTVLTTDEDFATSASFTLSDVDTPFNQLLLTATSSDQSVLADGGLSFGATGATTTLFIVPVTNATGQAAITVTVDDGVTTGSTSFTLTVNPVNDAPLVSVSGMTVTTEDASTSLSMKVSDVDTPFNSLILTATSANQSVVADGGISFGATGATTTLFVTPVTNASGQAAITVTVDDGSSTGTTSFTLTVNPANDAPLVSVTSAIATAEDTSTSLSMIVSDVDTPFSNLILSATSSNQALLPDSGIVFGATAATTSLILHPASDANGQALVTVTVDDGVSTVSTSFTLTVSPVNDPPSLSTTSPTLTSVENRSTTTVLSLSDVDTPFANLLLSATSSNQSLLPDAGLAFSATAATMQLSITSACAQSGSALITVRVSDGEFSSTTSFNLIVQAVTALSISGSTCGCPGVNYSYTVVPALPSATHNWTVDGGAIVSGQGTPSVNIRWEQGAAASLVVTRNTLAGCSTTSLLTVTPKSVQAIMDYSQTSAAGVTLAVLANDLGTDLTLESVEDPHGGLASVKGSTIEYRPDSGFYGVDTFSYTLESGDGCRATGAIVAVVTEAGNEPVNLEFLAHYKNRRNGLRGLRQAADVAISADGRHVYASGRGDHSLAMFNRDLTSGTLSYIGRVRQGAGGVSGLKYPFGLDLSPDGRQLYAAGYAQHSILVFDRDKGSGALSFAGRKRQGASEGTASIDGIIGPRDVAVSPDGRNVYAVGFAGHTLAVFERLPGSGQLIWMERHKDGLGGVDGLRNALAVTVAPDGRHVYVAGNGDDAVAVFSRSLTDGALSFVERQRDGVMGVDGLAGVSAIAVSPNGRFLLASAIDDDALTVFSRNPTSGALTFIARYRDGIDGVDGLKGANDLAISPDGRHVWTAALTDDALALFECDPDTGLLTWLEMAQDGQGGVDGLDRAHGLTLDPRSRHIYCAGMSDDALAAFFRNRAPLAFDDAAGSVALNNSLLISPLGNDGDTDGHSLSITNVTGASLGTTSISGGGLTIDYDAGAAAGSDNFSYTVTDNHGATSTAAVTLNVVLPKLGIGPAGETSRSGSGIESAMLRVEVSPNPVEHDAELRIDIGTGAAVNVRIVKLNGALMAEFECPETLRGAHRLLWRARSADGGPFAAGVYLIIVQYPGEDGTLKRAERKFLVNP